MEVEVPADLSNLPPSNSPSWLEQQSSRSALSSSLVSRKAICPT